MSNGKLTYKEHRFKTDPKEMEFVNVFLREFSKDNNIDLIVFGQKENTCMTPKKYLTEKQTKIVVSTIQWLGSPVGQGFLAKLGFELIKK